MYTREQCEEKKLRYGFKKFSSIFGCEGYQDSTIKITKTTTVTTTTTTTLVVKTTATPTEPTPQPLTVDDVTAATPDTDQFGQWTGMDIFECVLLWIFIAHVLSIVLSALFLWSSALIGNTFGPSKLTRALDQIGHFFCLSGRVLVSCLTMTKRLGALFGLGRADGHNSMQTGWLPGRRNNRMDTIETVV